MHFPPRWKPSCLCFEQTALKMSQTFGELYTIFEGHVLEMFPHFECVNWAFCCCTIYRFLCNQKLFRFADGICTWMKSNLCVNIFVITNTYAHCMNIFSARFAVLLFLHFDVCSFSLPYRIFHEDLSYCIITLWSWHCIIMTYSFKKVAFASGTGFQLTQLPLFSHLVKNVLLNYYCFCTVYFGASSVSRIQDRTSQPSFWLYTRFLDILYSEWWTINVQLSGIISFCAVFSLLLVVAFCPLNVFPN